MSVIFVLQYVSKIIKENNPFLKEEFESPNRIEPNAARFSRGFSERRVFLCLVRLRIQLQALRTIDAVVGIHITHPYLTRPFMIDDLNYCIVNVTRGNPLSHTIYLFFNTVTFGRLWNHSM